MRRKLLCMSPCESKASACRQPKHLVKRVRSLSEAASLAPRSPRVWVVEWPFPEGRLACSTFTNPNRSCVSPRKSHSRWPGPQACWLKEKVGEDRLLYLTPFSKGAEKANELQSKVSLVGGLMAVSCWPAQFGRKGTRGHMGALYGPPGPGHRPFRWWFVSSVEGRAWAELWQTLPWGCGCQSRPSAEQGDSLICRLLSAQISSCIKLFFLPSDRLQLCKSKTVVSLQAAESSCGLSTTSSSPHMFMYIHTYFGYYKLFIF